MKFYTMLNDKMYILPPSFVEIYLKLTDFCWFNQDNPHFSSFLTLSSRVVCFGPEKNEFVGDDMRMHTSR